VPLLSGETVVGALDVQSTTPYAFGTEDVAILVTMADQLAVALQNARLFDQTARQARRESQVVEITSKIRAAGDMDAMLRTAVTELRQALGVGKAAVRLQTPSAARPGTDRLPSAPPPAASAGPASENQPSPAAPGDGHSGNGQHRASSNGNGNGNGAHKNGGHSNGGPGSGPDLI
jgi:hypothetical protein